MLTKELLSSVFNLSPTATLLLKVEKEQYVIHDANQAYLKLIGVNIDDILYKEIFNAFESNDQHQGQELLLDSFRHVIKAKEPHALLMQRYDLKASDSSAFIEKHWNIVNVPVLSKKGEVAWILNQVSDVTEKVKAKTSLDKATADSKKYLKLLKKAESISKFGTWELDLKTNRLFWSDGVFEICGYQPQEFEVDFERGLSVIHPDDREMVINQMQATLANGKEYKINKRFVAKNGQIKHIISRGSLIKDRDNGAIKLIGVFQDITDQISSELKVQETKDQFHLLLQGINGVIWESNATDFNYSIVSDQVENVFGYTATEWNSTPNFWQNHLHPDDRERTIKQFAQNVAVGDSFILEYRMIAAGERVIWIQDIVSIIKKQEEALFCRGLMVDVTHKKKLDTESGKIKLELQTIFDQSLDIICVIDKESKFVKVSAASEKIWGYQPLELLGKVYLDFIMEADHEKSMLATTHALEGLEITNLENRFVKKDQSEVIMLWSVRWDHESEFFYCIARDITQRKIEDEQLLLMQSVVTNTKDAVLITKAEPMDDPEKQPIIFANDAFSIISGYSVSEIVGKTPAYLRGENTDAQTRALVKEKLGKGDACEVEILNYRKSGLEFWINLSITPIKNAQGKITHWVSVQRDITERRNSEIQKNFINQLSSLFNEIKELGDVSKELLKLLYKSGDFRFTELWLVNSDNDKILLSAEYYEDQSLDNLYYSNTSIREFIYGDGMSGITWSLEAAQLWHDLEKHGFFKRHQYIQNSRVNSAISMPLFAQGEIIGVLLLATEHAYEAEVFYNTFSTDLGKHLGEQIKRKQLEGQFDLFFDSSQEILIITKPDGFFRRVNPAFCNLLGYTAKELTSRHFSEFVHPDDQNVTMTEFTDSLSGKVVHSYENRYRTKTGEWRWISWSSSEVINEEGLIYGYGRDVTEKKNLEELLRTSAKLSKVGSFEVNLVTKKSYWSAMTKQIHGIPLDEQPSLENGINFYKEGDSRLAIERAVNHALQTGEPWDLEAMIVTSKGKERWVRAIGLAEMQDGKCVRLYGSLQDIHERKVAELKHIEVLEERDTILERISDAFFAVDANYTIIYWNAQAEKILGQKSEKLIGANLWEIFPEAKQSTFFHSYERSFKEQVAVNFEEFYPPNNQWFEVHSYPSKNGLSVFFRDISFRKKAEQQLLIKSKQINAIAELNANLIQHGSWLSAFTECIPSIAESLAADRVYFYQYEQDDNEELYFELKTGWCNTDKKINNRPASYFRISSSAVTDFVAALEKNKIIHFVVDQSDFKYKELLLTTDVLSCLLIPVFADKKVSGFIGFDNCSQAMLWTKEEVNLIKTMVANLSSAIEQQNFECNLATAFEEKNAILESIGDAFFAADRHWIVTYWNKMAETVLMTPRDKVLGQNLWEVFNMSTDSLSYKNYHKAIETNSPVHFEDYFEPLKKWYEISAYPAANGITVYFKDITLRKEIDSRIRESNLRFEKVAEATNDAIWDWDIKNDQLFWGDGYRKLFGYQTGKMDPDLNLWSNNIHPEDRKGVLDNFQASSENPNEKYFHNEYRFKRADGSYAYVVDHGSIIRDKKGQAIRIVGAIQDISHHREYEASLKALNESLAAKAAELTVSNKELEQFAYVTSHDLQEPLRMITSFLNLLEKKYGKELDEKAHQYIYYATDGAKRMKQIILDLLAYSTIGKAEETTEPVNLNEIIDEIEILYRKKIEEKKASIRFNNLPTIKTNKSPIRQLFQNLINNALTYNSEDSNTEIIISCKDTGTHWQFCVSDNGIGITPEYHQKIFIIFQRLHTKEKYPGTGMGLAICKKIVENLGGEIWVESVENKGSNFYFTLQK